MQVGEQDRPGERLAGQQRSDPAQARARIQDERGRRGTVMGYGYAGGMPPVPDEVLARRRRRPADTAEFQPHRAQPSDPLSDPRNVSGYR